MRRAHQACLARTAASNIGSVDFQLIAIALGDIAWIVVAFVLGYLAKTMRLPPLVGFLVAGFLLNVYGIVAGEMLEKLADLGITLLLFMVGLKLNLRTFARPQVWAVTALHMSLVVLVFGVAIYAMALVGLPLIAGFDLQQAVLIAFAMSFSSTVVVVKTLEENGESASLHGRIAVGILIVQDLAAVGFLAFSTGKLPTYWALLVLLVVPLKPLMLRVLERGGHGELLVLIGLILALGGAQVFEMVGLKGDLGALFLGVLIASHPKADELAKTMLGFKDLFLLAFFLSIGLSGQLTTESVLLGVAMTPLLFFKAALFFALLAAFKLRSRTSLFASLNLANFSEFGLIVAAICVANGWLGDTWLVAIAVALSLSCAVSAGLNVVSRQMYARYRSLWKRLQRSERLADDQPLDIGRVTIAVIGMGRIGTAAYDYIHERHGGTVVGLDSDPKRVRHLQATGRNVLLGDPSDADFWDRVQSTHRLELVLVALPSLAANLAAIEQFKAVSFEGRLAAIAQYEDEVELLEAAGASTTFNVYAEAGTGFAAHVTGRTSLPAGSRAGQSA